MFIFSAHSFFLEEIFGNVMYI